MWRDDELGPRTYGSPWHRDDLCIVDGGCCGRGGRPGPSGRRGPRQRISRCPIRERRAGARQPKTDIEPIDSEEAPAVEAKAPAAPEAEAPRLKTRPANAVGAEGVEAATPKCVESPSAHSAARSEHVEAATTCQ